MPSAQIISTPQILNTPLHDYLTILARPALMAIINLTPDSFSGDGLMPDSANPTSREITKIIDNSIKVATQSIKDGADLLDLGAESSRPGASNIPYQMEQRRLLPVLEALRAEFPSLPISIDSQKPETMSAGLTMGANIINDIAYGKNKTRDQAVQSVLKKAQNFMGYILMHNNTQPTNHNLMGELDESSPLATSYARAQLNQQTLIQQMEIFFAKATEELLTTALQKNQLVWDLGFGFGKTPEDSLQLLQQWDYNNPKHYPLLIGLSRKSFLTRLVGMEKMAERLPAALTAEILALEKGVKFIRAHEIKPRHIAMTMHHCLKTQTRPDYYIGLGSNLGNRQTHIQQAIHAVHALGRIIAISPFYETAPQINQQQPDFLNGIIKLQTTLEPLKLLSQLKIIEKKLGRSLNDTRYQPRVIDLDIISYGEQVWQTPNLTLPHPLAFQRAFVLQPLIDLNPYFIFRQLGKLAIDLLAPLLPKQIIHRTAFIPSVSPIRS